MPDDDLVRAAARSWIRSDDYVEALARRRTARRKREPGRRTEPETPRLLLSTLPFLALIAGLAVLTAGIMVAAWPGRPAQRRVPHQAAREQGVAQKGWFQQAQREFH